MSYMALYRKFRPNSFDEVKGQDAVVATLRNQIKSGRIGHAYLFCGTRGTGKTSIAKIFARAVNCENPLDGNPCGKCATCRAIQEQTSLNVIEIDAASNNGVDNIREIRQEVSYMPSSGKYRVYIIDEVHMLSIGAFNALLKTLEEPPSYIIFILATTESHKIPVTILSRCQRYDFRRISADTITGRLGELMDSERVDVQPEALEYIAKTADGSMRDALSLLDQCISYHIGETLTYDMVLEILGTVDTDVFSRLLRSVYDGDVTKCMDVLKEQIGLGKELGQFVTDFIWYLRNVLIAKSTGRPEDVLDMSSEALLRVMEEREFIGEDSLMRYIRIFSELSDSMRYALQKRVLLETALIRLCRPQMDVDITSVLERVRVLERTIEDMQKNTSTVSAPETQPEIFHAASPPKAKALVPAAPEDLQKVKSGWGEIVSHISGGFKPMLLEAALKYDSNDAAATLFIEFHDEIARLYIDKPENKKLLEDAISDYTGRFVEVRMLIATDHSAGDKLYEITVDEILEKDIHCPVVIEE